VIDADLISEKAVFSRMQNDRQRSVFRNVVLLKIPDVGHRYNFRKAVLQNTEAYANSKISIVPDGE
jgi:hypothetical protein